MGGEEPYRDVQRMAEHRLRGARFVTGGFLSASDLVDAQFSFKKAVSFSAAFCTYNYL